MALKAGYNGIKRSVASMLTKLASDMSGAVIIKSIGSGLLFDESTGELSADVNPSVETAIDFTEYTDYIESASVMSVTKTEESAAFSYGSGGAIGCRIAKQLDVSGIDFVKVNVEITSLYSASFPIKLGIAASTTAVYNGTYITSSSISESGELMLDVRGLNGSLYLTFDGSGANAVFSNGVIISQDI